MQILFSMLLKDYHGRPSKSWCTFDLSSVLPQDYVERHQISDAGSLDCVPQWKDMVGEKDSLPFMSIL